MAKPLPDIVADVSQRVIALRLSVESEFNQRAVLLTRVNALIASFKDLEKAEGRNAKGKVVQPFFTYARDSIYRLEQVRDSLRQGLFDTKGRLLLQLSNALELTEGEMGNARTLQGVLVARHQEVA